MIANRLISRATNVRLHDYGCTLKAIRADVVKELKIYGEMHRFIPAVASFVGCRVYEMKVNHRARQHGKSKYGIGRTTRVLLDLITVLFLKSYLVRPMQVFGFWSLVCLVLGVGICGTLAFQRLVYGAPLADRPLLLLGTILVLVGAQLMSLGLIADVVGRTYYAASGKPAYCVRSWVRGAELAASDRGPVRVEQHSPPSTPPVQ
jgi:hypothetical protein